MFHFLGFLITKYWYLFILFILAGLILFFVSASNYICRLESPFLKAVGIHQKARQVMLVKKALYWEVRAWKHRNGIRNFSSLTPRDKVYGWLEAMTESGEIVYQYYQNDRIMRSRAKLANVDLVDMENAARDLLGNRNKKAVFDIYKGNEIVVWMPDELWNLSLIQKEYGVPDKNPPTNLVDRLFAEYYWIKLENLGKGGGS